MRKLVVLVLGLLFVFAVACSSGPGGGFCDALVSNCNSNAKTCKNLLDADALDHPTCVEKRDAFLGCMANQKITCPDSSTIYAGAGKTGARFSLDSYTAYTNASCASLGDTWLACHDNKAPCTFTSDGASQTIVLTPSKPSATAPAAKLVAPGSGNHSWDTKYDVDLTAFIGNGILTIRGTLGTTGTEASFDLFPGCAALPSSGGTDDGVASAHNVSLGSMWTLTYSFDRGAVFHFAAEGNWNSQQGQTNTSTIEMSVTQ